MSGVPVLITGIAGFVGSRLAGRLLDANREVHGLVRSTTDLSTLGKIRPRISLHSSEGDLASLTRTIQKTGAQTCFHLAARFVAHHRPEDAQGLIESNISFGAELLEALAAAGVPQIVNAGTLWQHYESRPYSPVSLYAATKQAFQDLLRFYAEDGRLRAITLKLCDTYGNQDPRPKLLNALKKAVQQNTLLEMSSGQQYLDLLHVEDVVEALLIAEREVEKAAPGSYLSYGIGSGRPLRLRELVSLFERCAGKTLNIDWGRKPDRPREMLTPWSSDPALPGFAPRVSLEQGLKKLLEEKT